MNSYQLSSLRRRDLAQTTSEHDTTAAKTGSQERDRLDLARAGKKAILKRNFGFMSILGFSCTILLTWEASLASFGQGYQNGGPSGIIYGFVFVWLGTFCVYASLAELVSMAPTAGGQYFWVSMLAPPKIERFLSYITGWLTMLGWQAALASGCLLVGELLATMIAVANPTYNPQNWHITLMFWIPIFISVLLNATAGIVLPRFEGLLLIFHILGFFGIMLPLVVLGKKQPVEAVFENWINGGNWPSVGLSFFVGLTGTVFSFSGGDSSFHMSEEIEHAAINVPYSIMSTVLINGSLGFGILLTILFRFGDPDTILAAPFPAVALFLDATNSVAGSLVMASIILVMFIAASPGYVAVTSRMIWAFSRDRGLPFWRFLVRLDKRTSLPTNCVLLTAFVAILLSLINLGSSQALQVVLSFGNSSIYTTYLICTSLLLWRRCMRTITHRSNSNVDDPTNVPGAAGRLTWGPWHMPGIFGVTINAVAVAYLIIVLFFSYWPAELPVNAGNMNWSVLLEWGIVVLATGYYVVIGRKEFQGPLIEVGGIHDDWADPHSE